MSRSKPENPTAAIQRQFVNEITLAAVTGVARRTYQKWRLLGQGPRFYRLHGSIRYDLHEVYLWIEQHAAGGEGRAR